MYLQTQSMSDFVFCLTQKSRESFVNVKPKNQRQTEEFVFIVSLIIFYGPATLILIFRRSLNETIAETTAVIMISTKAISVAVLSLENMVTINNPKDSTKKIIPVNTFTVV